MEYVSNIIKNVLLALYQNFGTACVISVLFMFAYMYAKEHGIKRAIKEFLTNIKNSKRFQRIFWLAFYTSMILLRTLLFRSLWTNPIENVIGTWELRDKNGNLYTENIENMILFVPFVTLLFWAARSKIFVKKPTFIMCAVKRLIRILCKPPKRCKIKK